MQKKKLNFFKNCWLLGPFLKKPCFWKMGMAGIKWQPCLSTRPSFSVNINEEAFLKVSFKNIDWFQISKNYFFQRGPKNKQILKNLHFFPFLFALSTDFSMVYCLFSYSQWCFQHLNFTAVSSQLATTVAVRCSGVISKKERNSKEIFVSQYHKPENQFYRNLFSTRFFCSVLFKKTICGLRFSIML